MKSHSMASLMAVFYLLFLLINFPAARAQKKSNNIDLGSALFASTHTMAWFSPARIFAFGFFPEGKGYKVGIWIVGYTNNVITVWTANRDDPAVSSNATLEFIDGKIRLRSDEQSQPQIISGSSEAASFASMLDSGNFVLYNAYHDIIWESFENPTDTILGGQILLTGQNLVSNLSPTDHSSGRFILRMQYDGNLAAYLVNTTECYWASDTWNQTHITRKQLNLSSVDGKLEVVNVDDSSDVTGLAKAFPSINVLFYRATLDDDGNFRLYSHSIVAEGQSKLKKVTQWEAVDDICSVEGLCGYNSYCTKNYSEPRCLCIQGFSFSDLNNTFAGCDRDSGAERCIGGKENATLHDMTEVNLSWKDHPYSVENIQGKENCSMSCSEDCDCGAALYVSRGSSCSKYKLPLKYLSENADGTAAFLKLTHVVVRYDNPMSDPNKPPRIKIVPLSLSFAIYSFIVLGLFSVFILKFHITKYKNQLLETGRTSLTKEFTLRTFTYNELKKATSGFKHELGKGSFGAVYRGTLDNGKSFVAVKKLQKLVEEGEREFLAETRVIGRTHHRNLVRLLGYCIEGSKRLLIYEYMMNGSLADHLYGTGRHLNWQERIRIALDVAKGIFYLHEECQLPIIHCDIKPQNILLDFSWTAKISDFGLAKLLMPDQTRTYTIVRGTRGYMAPEWEKNVPISMKVDIYSFGIVLLEIICCRKNLDVNLLRPEESLLSVWTYRCLMAKQLDKLVDGEEVDRNTLERMVLVALWCIQDEPALRFPIKTVMLMLEGIIDVPMPPCPTASSSA